MTASLAFNIEDQGHAYTAYYDPLERAAQTAWTAAMQRFDYTSGTVTLTMKLMDLGTGTAAATAPQSMTPIGQAADGTWVYQGSTVPSILGDPHAVGNNGISMEIGTFWLVNAVPSAANPSPMWNGDAARVFAHEVTGHGLGFLTYWDSATRTPPSQGYETSYDQNVRMVGGIPYFVGPNAEAVYGGPVPLDRSIDHPATGGGVSNMSYVDPATSQQALDIAMLRDSGVPILSDREMAEHTVIRLYYVEHGATPGSAEVEQYANRLGGGESPTAVALSMLGGSGTLAQAQAAVALANSDEVRAVLDRDPNISYAASTGEEVARLDDAAFGTTPVPEGYARDTSALITGTTLQQLAIEDMASSGFIAHYGSAPSSEAFVTELYANVLGRSPDAAGAAHWLAALDSQQITRVQALVGFSDSQEHIRDMANAVALQTPAGYSAHTTTPLGMLPVYAAPGTLSTA